MCMLDKLTEKYATKELVMKAVTADAAKRGLNLEPSSYMKASIGKSSSGTEIPGALYGVPLFVFHATKDALDYLLMVPVSEPWEQNVVCTSDILRLEKQSDTMYRVQTHADNLYIAVENAK